MPLPTNEAQESIARRLAQHRNVAVQGPPGTGKTHTIRNLICHLMAQRQAGAGRRAEGGPAAGAPRRPARGDPVALPGRARPHHRPAGPAPAGRAGAVRPGGHPRPAGPRSAGSSGCTGLLEEAERELAAALGGLRAIAENEAVHLPDRRRPAVARRGGRLAAGARRRARRHPRRGPPHARRPLTADEFAALLELAARTVRRRPGRGAAARCRRPAMLPDAVDGRAPRAGSSPRTRAELRAGWPQPVSTSVRYGRSAGRRSTSSPGSCTTRSPGCAAGRARGPTGSAGCCSRSALADDVGPITSPPPSALLAELAALTRTVAGHRVTVPDAYLAGTAPAAGRARRAAAAVRRRQGREPAAAGRALPARRRVPGRRRAAAHRRGRRRGRRLGAPRCRAQAASSATRWTEWLESLALPRGPGIPEVWAGRLLADAAVARTGTRDAGPALRATRPPAARPRAELTVDVPAAALAELVGRCSASSPTTGSSPMSASWAPCCRPGCRRRRQRAVAAARPSRGRTTWPAGTASLDEVRRLAALRPDAERFTRTRANGSAGAAPEWAAQIDAGHGARPVAGAACLDALAVAAGADLVRRRDRQRRPGGARPAGRAGPRQDPAAHRRAGRRVRLAGGRRAASTTGGGPRSPTGPPRCARSARAPGGTPRPGRRTRSGRWSRRVDAVPVWVMSVDRAIEQFAGGAHFDVVIVDEASQADLFALPVLSLAERAVVVGDDQQIGPQLGFVGSVAGLIHSHLGDVPSAEHFDPECSPLRPRGAALAGADPAHRALPVRAADHRVLRRGTTTTARSAVAGRPAGRLGDPVRAVFLPDGRAPAARRLRRRQRGRGGRAGRAGRGDRRATRRTTAQTLGVISLLSTSGQAALPAAPAARGDRRGRDRGAAAAGRRRVHVPGRRARRGAGVDGGRPTTTAAGRRVHQARLPPPDQRRRVPGPRPAVDLPLGAAGGSLPADDARALLLTYARTPVDRRGVRRPGAALRQRLRAGRCCAGCCSAGYRPMPQFRIGGYRIDFVLNAPDGRRLAIECDGDGYHGPEQWESDMRRQAVLERVGNCVFVRIRGSIFARDPEAALRAGVAADRRAAGSAGL